MASPFSVLEDDSKPGEDIPREDGTSQNFTNPVQISKQQIAESYELLRQSLCSSLRYRGLTAEDVEDVVQEAFLRLMVRTPKNANANTIRYWLLRVARNLAIDLQRSGWRCTLDQQSIDSVTSSVPSKVSDPEEILLATERFERLQDDLSALTPRQQQAILLRISGRTYKEIAVRIDSTTHGVEELIRRGLKRLGREYPTAEEF